ncbi:PREDICTED: uncharacterized protein LOC108538777 [Rhinopithecus bieti]|uniref:uncharacterized protein LOC108538777 n=1 Tax=Rhinopithecus bieti TaxID=61621 RepID=UPI00083C31E9|nr:PREDICTED: uncharacterized protein LOC108538777 [Rhinopithecus bieti]
MEHQGNPLSEEVTAEPSLALEPTAERPFYQHGLRGGCTSSAKRRTCRSHSAGRHHVAGVTQRQRQGGSTWPRSLSAGRPHVAGITQQGGRPRLAWSWGAQAPQPWVSDVAAAAFSLTPTTRFPGPSPVTSPPNLGPPLLPALTPIPGKRLLAPSCQLTCSDEPSALCSCSVFAWTDSTGARGRTAPALMVRLLSQGPQSLGAASSRSCLLEGVLHDLSPPSCGKSSEQPALGTPSPHPLGRGAVLESNEGDNRAYLSPVDPPPRARGSEHLHHAQDTPTLEFCVLDLEDSTE